jgi:hypothetical protein
MIQTTFVPHAVINAIHVHLQVQDVQHALGEQLEQEIIQHVVASKENMMMDLRLIAKIVTQHVLLAQTPPTPTATPVMLHLIEQRTRGQVSAIARPGTIRQIL